MTKISENERLILYQDQLDNIRELNTANWRTVQHGLLIQAAIVGALRLAETNNDLIQIVAVVLSGFAALFAFLLIHHMQGKITRRRVALDVITDEPQETFLELREKLVDMRQVALKDRGRWKDEGLYAILFLSVSVLGFASVYWLILIVEVSCK